MNSVAERRLAVESTDDDLDLLQTTKRHLAHLTLDIKDRSTGSEGNKQAAGYIRDVMRGHALHTQLQTFSVLDWEDGLTRLTADDGSIFEVSASPFSNGCDVQGELVIASSLAELSSAKARGALVLLVGALAQAPLMPKNFPFYTDEAQQQIIAALEESGAAAILCATPVPPMIEDGDFHLPSVFLSEEEGSRLSGYAGRQMHLTSTCRRMASNAANVVGMINAAAEQRIVITAHLDAKKSVPGALDNGTGITTLLLLAELLKDYDGSFGIDLAALNGEDHYAVPGQCAYLAANPTLSENCLLNINVDGVGYLEGETAYSFFSLPDRLEETARATLLSNPGTCESILWPQGDHSMFVQAGCPAVAVTSQWLLDNMEAQSITHSEHDRMELVDLGKVVANALAIRDFLRAMV